MSAEDKTPKTISFEDWRIAVEIFESGRYSIDSIASQFGLPLFTAKELLKDPTLLGEDGIVPKITRRAIRYFTISKGPKPKTAAEYNRASGIPTQILKTNHYCLANDIEVIEPPMKSYSTNKNADFFNTPEFLQAVDIAEEESADILMCGAFRLLSRFPIEHGQGMRNRLNKKGIDLIDCDNGLSVVFSGVMSFIAAYNSAYQNQVIRNIRGMMSAKNVDYHTNNPFPGINSARVRARKLRTELRPEIEEVIEELSAVGKPSLQKIADELNRRGIKTINGRAWSKGTINNILKKLEIDHRK